MMDANDVPTHAIGTYEEGLAWLDKPSATTVGAFPVDDVRVAQYCAMIEDGNASYWDADFAQRAWGRSVAPPGSLQLWVKTVSWTPAGEQQAMTLLQAVPLPGASIINVFTDVEYHRPIHVGETIGVRYVATAISAQKTTRLGTGHFLTTQGQFETETGERVATATNVQFRFDPKADGA